MSRSSRAAEAVTRVALEAFSAPAEPSIISRVLPVLQDAVGADVAAYFIHDPNGWTGPAYLTPDEAWQATSPLPMHLAGPFAGCVGLHGLRSGGLRGRCAGPHGRGEAAARLGISARTAQKHAEHIYRKLGVHNRYDALRACTGLGLSTA